MTFHRVPMRLHPTENVYVIDPLGAETPEQRAERKAAESPAKKALNAVLVTVALVVAALAIWASGVYIGATEPLVWNHVPGVEEPPTVWVPAEPSPSGERAEPEHVPGLTLERSK